ncbi:MAG: hypothetical protein IJS90_03080 [Clostridia bacterium]|nr:hypothetical protein [Clostridia bacterium]
MKTCRNCGSMVEDNSEICKVCGANVQLSESAVEMDETERSVLNELVKRINLESNIWIIIGILQILSLFGIIAGIYNIYTCVKDKKYAKEIIQKPVGIYNNFESLSDCIINLVINFIFGSMIGIIGSIYHLMAIREYVIKNKAVFDSLEKKNLS